eukprot:9214471-Pyramimonas_sp.AAC.1
MSAKLPCTGVRLGSGAGRECTIRLEVASGALVTAVLFLTAPQASEIFLKNQMDTGGIETSCRTAPSK